MKILIISKFFALLIAMTQVLSASVISVKEIESPDKMGPWPEFEVTMFINASPMESVAIYYALDYQKDYVPGVIKSTVVDQPNPREAITKYEFKTPWPLPNSTYTNGSKLTKIKNIYRVDWWFIENSAAKDLFGYASFSPHENGTKLIYRSYISPKNFLASFFKARAKRDLAHTLIEIKRHIETLKKENSPILRKYIQVIKDTLKNKYTYIKN